MQSRPQLTLELLHCIFISPKKLSYVQCLEWNHGHEVIKSCFFHYFAGQTTQYKFVISLHSGQNAQKEVDKTWSTCFKWDIFNCTSSVIFPFLLKVHVYFTGIGVHAFPERAEREAVTWSMAGHTVSLKNEEGWTQDFTARVLLPHRGVEQEHCG